MRRRGVLRGLKRTLLTGFFVIAPFSLSFILLVWFVASVDGLLAPLASTLIGRPVPGLGLAAALAIVLAVGVLANNIVGQQLLEYFEEVLLRIPVFSWLYRAFRQIADVFSPANRSAFRRVVLVEYPRPGVYSLGFVTNELTLERRDQNEKLVCVYVPTNHMYIGDFVLVPEDKVLSTHLSLQEGIECVLSAGSGLPERLRLHQPR